MTNNMLMIMIMTRGWRFYSCNFLLFNEASHWSLWASKAKVIRELKSLRKKTDSMI
jgi:hypothetical protein